MKKIFKCLMIFPVLFLLSGWDWKTIESNYGTILNNGLSCSYNYNGNDDISIEKIGLRFSNKSIIAAYNFKGGYSGSNLIYLSGSKYFEHDLSSGGKYIYVDYNGFDFDNYLSMASDLGGKCPSNINVCTDHASDENLFIYESQRNGLDGKYSCYSFDSTEKSSVKVDNEDAYCIDPYATACTRYRFTDSWSRDVAIEIGITNNSGKYMKISFDDFNSTHTATEKNGYLTYTFGQDTYQLSDYSIFDLEDNKFTKIGRCDFNNNGTYLHTLYDAKRNPSYCGSLGLEPADDDDNDDPEEPTESRNIITNICAEQNVLKAIRIAGYILFIVKMLVPLLLIILGIIDLAKAVVSNDDKANSVAVNSLIRRVIIAVVIFILPTIINYGLTLVDGAVETFKDSKFTNCTTCLLDPSKCDPEGMDE